MVEKLYFIEIEMTTYEEKPIHSYWLIDVVVGPLTGMAGKFKGHNDNLWNGLVQNHNEYRINDPLSTWNENWEQNHQYWDIRNLMFFTYIVMIDDDMHTQDE